MTGYDHSQLRNKLHMEIFTSGAPDARSKFLVLEWSVENAIISGSNLIRNSNPILVVRTRTIRTPPQCRHPQRHQRDSNGSLGLGVCTGSVSEAVEYLESGVCAYGILAVAFEALFG